MAGGGDRPGVYRTFAARLIGARRDGWRAAWRGSSVVALVPLVIVLVGLLALRGYRMVAYPAEYQRGDQILTRVFWHNIVSGLAFHPDFAEREQIRIDDVSVAYAVGRYLEANGRMDEWVAMGGRSPGLTGLLRAPYDPAARDFLVDRCRAEPQVCLMATTYYKPRSLLEHLAWLYGADSLPPDVDLFVSRYWGDAAKVQMTSLVAKLEDTGLRGGLWSPEAMVVVAGLSIALALTRRRHMTSTWIAAGGLGAGSLLPTTIGYPSTWTIVEPAIVITAMLYLAAAHLAAVVLARISLCDTRPGTTRPA